MNEVLTLRGVSKGYPGVRALHPTDLTLPRDRVVGLLGPNGSGKSTMLKLIAGLLVPDTGEITVAGCPIGEGSRARLSYLPERGSLPLRMTALEAIDYFSDFFGDFERSRAEGMLDRLAVPKDRPLRTLSKGNREKLQLALVMSRRADLYLLDEPIGGVDPAARDFILAVIKEMRAPGSTILVSTHLIADVEPILDDYVMIKDGRLLRYDSVAHTVAAEGRSLDAVFREVFRC